MIFLRVNRGFRRRRGAIGYLKCRRVFHTNLQPRRTQTRPAPSYDSYEAMYLS